MLKGGGRKKRNYEEKRSVDDVMSDVVERKNDVRQS